MPKIKTNRKTATAKPRLVSKKTKTKTNDARSADFEAVFVQLKKVLAKFAPPLKVVADEPGKYLIVTKANSWKGGPMSFGAVQQGKAYVSYHLMPLYIHPHLVKLVSPALKKRMQGLACFNFRAADKSLFAELARLTGKGLDQYRSQNLL